MSSGRRAAIDRPNSRGPGCRNTLTTAVALEPVGELQRRQEETSVATRSPTASPSGDDCGPPSATVPMSMPPEPVTGFCILPRVATMWGHLRAHGVPVARVLSLSWRERMPRRG